MYVPCILSIVLYRPKHALYIYIYIYIYIHHPPAGSVTRFTRGGVWELKNAHNSVTVQNRTHVYMNFFDHKDLGNHLLQ